VPEHASALADERQGVAREIPKYRAQRREPLNAQHHVILAEREGVDVDVERLTADVHHLLCGAA
jgi:hypothetical protein